MPAAARPKPCSQVLTECRAMQKFKTAPEHSLSTTQTACLIASIADQNICAYRHVFPRIVANWTARLVSTGPDSGAGPQLLQGHRLIRSVVVFGYPLNGMIVAAQTPRRIVKLGARQEPESAVRGDTELSKQCSQATDCQASVRTEVSTVCYQPILWTQWCHCSFTDGMSVFGRHHALITACVLQVIPNKSPPSLPEAPALHLLRKRKADAVDDQSEHPEARRAHSLYQTSIAAPLRRARRRLLCMSKVGLPASIWFVMTKPLAPMKATHLNFPAAILLNHGTCSASAALQSYQLHHLLKSQQLFLNFECKLFRLLKYVSLNPY